MIWGPLTGDLIVITCVKGSSVNSAVVALSGEEVADQWAA